MKRLATLAVIPWLFLWPSTESPPGYAPLDRRGEPFKGAFNADAGKIRIVAYVSPTCGGCLRGADQMQERVLAEIHDPDLRIYVVWVRKNGARERDVSRVTQLVTDPRATHYWDEEGAVLEELDALLGLEGRPCAGAFLLYDGDARWEGSTPPRVRSTGRTRMPASSSNTGRRSTRVDSPRRSVSS